MLRKIAGLAIAASAWGLTAEAQDNVFWRSVGNWEISIDPGLSNGCYAVSSWSSGTVLRIGLNPAEDSFYFLIGNEDWASLEDDREYEIKIRFGPQPAWNISARGLRLGDAPGGDVYLHAKSENFDFVEEFMREARMTMFYRQSAVETFVLKGSSRAFQEVRKCQRAVAENGLPGDDDLASRDRVVDPFAE
ncbi:hypothetical protein AIOL_000857 [Candidatus Rhodobacter oscarellae]|uniref:Uncharacterized protein n=1 Tax=Candidatus Rhodobacter oscarellae TaxID=1675527 RepID=A0A0J9H538_9RHOB|nr:hypothetical protein [Candidatus Rhodobacter lobularis]KMW60693.1 hypothetical protein AIOL_000857 [Candidatus Rhodobacter lobularis]